MQSLENSDLCNSYYYCRALYKDIIVISGGIVLPRLSPIQLIIWIKSLIILYFLKIGSSSFKLFGLKRRNLTLLQVCNSVLRLVANSCVSSF
ncbi:hypothetical protein BDV3_000359 [Batrachochytrium dendrobatidis]